MSFYNLNKEERAGLVKQMGQIIHDELQSGNLKNLLLYYSDNDTYIRKSAYLLTGRIYLARKPLQSRIISTLEYLLKEEDYKIRQTTVNASGEIGKLFFDKVAGFFDKGLFDPNHSVRNAVIGSIKKMGEKNPEPVLEWARSFLHHPDKEVRREICHGIELRGRKHPEDILPLLQELQFDQTARVRNTLVHVLGQIAYKQGCLKIVLDHLKGWGNKSLVKDALEEIIDVHHRYRNFAVLSREEAIEVIANSKVA